MNKLMPLAPLFLLGCAQPPMPEHAVLAKALMDRHYEDPPVCVRSTFDRPALDEGSEAATCAAEYLERLAVLDADFVTEIARYNEPAAMTELVEIKALNIGKHRTCLEAHSRPAALLDCQVNAGRTLNRDQSFVLLRLIERGVVPPPLADDRQSDAPEM